METARGKSCFRVLEHFQCDEKLFYVYRGIVCRAIDDVAWEAKFGKPCFCVSGEGWEWKLRDGKCLRMNCDA
jgi:hypothetical protein